MRLERVVNLGGYSVTVKELTVAQVRNLLAQAATAAEEWLKLKSEVPTGDTNGDTNTDNLKFLPLVNQKIGVLLSETNNLLVFPEGKTIDDLGLSEVEKLWEVFVQLNPFVQKKLREQMRVLPG